MVINNQISQKDKNMNKVDLNEFLTSILPEVSITSEGKQFVEITVQKDKLHEVANKLKSNDNLSFDYLLNLTAVDYLTKFTMIYHLEANATHQLIVLKSDIEDRENPNIDTISDIWATAEFHEREVFDLFGIKFNNHPDLRRLFLEDNEGFPLRKDFKDDINFIELKK